MDRFFQPSSDTNPRTAYLYQIFCKFVLIDFGLSNSVRVAQSPDGSNSMQEFCVTQCGSPAYAAPELLGNAKYGPKVDIWSMYVAGHLLIFFHFQMSLFSDNHDAYFMQMNLHSIK